MSNQKLKLIAELCQNHKGSPEVVFQMLREAKQAGATHAKIQNMYSWELTRRDEFENPAQPLYRPYSPEFSRLSGLDLEEETETQFVLEAHEIGITPMTTVFTHEGLRRARRAGFKSIKIASYDCASLPLIKGALDFALELVISTGASYWSEVNDTIAFVQSTGFENVTYLHASTRYPNTVANMNLGRMLELASLGIPAGFSDHSDTRVPEDAIVASKLAIALGAKAIERHFTIFDWKETKDGPVSVNPIQLAELSEFSLFWGNGDGRDITSLFSAEVLKSLADVSLEPGPEELLNRSYYRGRFASTHADKLCYSWQECGH